ncbi:MAG: FMN-binding protein [Candidatus Izemoplasmatales bacterium]
MKVFFGKHGFILILVAIFVLIFGLGGVYSRFMTSELEEHIEENATGAEYALYLEMFPGADTLTPYTPGEVSKTYPLAGGRGDFAPTVDKALKIFQGTSEKGVVYVINTKGKEPMKVGVGISLENDACVGIAVLEQNDTPDYFSQLGDPFYSQFDAKALSDLALAVDTFAGVTYSSKAFEIALFYARELYAADYDFVIPTVAMTLVKLEYNFDPTTFIASPYIANIIYGDQDTEAAVMLSASFDYVGLVGGGTDLEADFQAAVKALAQGAGTLNTQANFVSFDEENNTLVMQTKGYNPNAIQASIVLNDTLDIVVSITFVSMETYANQGGYGDYTGGPAPAVENNLRNQYLADGDPNVDGVAGATVSSNAVRSLLQLLDGFVEAQNGGE